jgi:hypothetical protein
VDLDDGLIERTQGIQQCRGLERQSGRIDDDRRGAHYPRSITAAASWGFIAGLGAAGYELALRGLARRLADTGGASAVRNRTIMSPHIAR